MNHLFRVALQVPAFLYVTPIFRQILCKWWQRSAHWPHNPSQWTGLHSDKVISGLGHVPELEPNPWRPGLVPLPLEQTRRHACMHTCTYTHSYTQAVNTTVQAELVLAEKSLGSEVWSSSHSASLVTQGSFNYPWQFRHILASPPKASFLQTTISQSGLLLITLEVWETLNGLNKVKKFPSAVLLRVSPC